MAETSLSILERAKSRRDQQAWRDVSAIYSPLLRSWIARYDVAASDADDLVQEVLLFVSDRLGEFEHNGRTGAFRCWLRQVLVNRLRKFWAQENRQPAGAGRSDILSQLQQLEDPHSSLSQMWDREHREHVARELLERIHARYEQRTWQAFQLTVIEGLKPAEAAKRLTMSANAVCAAKCRVLNGLRHEGRGMLD